jgi:DNA (cytosine-5)-methyltransferase 1
MKERNSETSSFPIAQAFSFIDLFAGIGGTRLAFERAGGKCVFSSEMNDMARKTYTANYGDEPAGDITKISASDIPDHDILVAGFPCQPFSIAGVSKYRSLNYKDGFEHATKGTLFFDVARILKEKRPKAFLLENVKNLTSHDGGNTFKVIENTLRKDLGYNISYMIIDAKPLVPQHRERIYIVGFDERIDFKFPELQNRNVKLADILEANPDPKYTLTDHLWGYLQKYAEKHKAKGNGFGFGLAKLDGYTRTLSARYYKDGSEILIPQQGKNPRRLTPRECARLMGFPDSFAIVVSDTSAYRQFGNSVVVPVVEAIAKEIVHCLVSGRKKVTMLDYASQ